MIYTLTLNPSIDYVVEFPSLCVGGITRIQKEDFVFGGKGVNVSHMLKILGTSSVALGFVAGFTGKAFVQGVKGYGIQPMFIEVDDGFTRINVKIHAEEESEINGSGPVVSKLYLDKLMKLLDKIKENDILVLSGSVAKGMKDNIYADIMKHVEDKRIKVVVDACGNALHHTLKYHPFLIKPNKEELEEYFHVNLSSINEMLACAKMLQKEGARNILVSLAENGALLLCENGEVLRCNAVKGKVVNSVGAGDSMVAGFLHVYEQKKDMKKALQMGVACGSATAFSKGIASKKSVEEILERMDANL